MKHKQHNSANHITAVIGNIIFGHHTIVVQTISFPVIVISPFKHIPLLRQRRSYRHQTDRRQQCFIRTANAAPGLSPPGVM